MSASIYLVILLNFFLIVDQVKSDGNIIVIAPRSIRSNSVYSLSVSSIGATEPTKLRIRIIEREEQPHNKTILNYVPNSNNVATDPLDLISLFGPQNLNTESPKAADLFSNDWRLDTAITFLRRKTVLLKPNTPKLVSFKIGRDINPGSYQLEVQTLNKSATVFFGRQLLYIEVKSFSMFIQTNKAIYRPGDLVQYRILILDPDTKPIKVENSLQVSVLDANDNLILLYRNQSALQGVYRSEFRVGEDDKIGIWTVEANYKNQLVRKTIEVAEYMSERIQVAVSVPAFISRNSTQFLISVNAKYTFGKPVRGIVTAKVTPVFQAFGAWPELGEPVSITDVIDGKYIVGFNLADFGESDLGDYNAMLVEASVQEKTTGITAKSRDKTVVIDAHKSHTKYSISVNSLKFYLPGKEYLLTVQVDAKNGRPLPEKSRELAIEIIYLSDTFEDKLIHTAILDGKGRADVIIDVPATKMTHIKFKMQYLNALEEVTIVAKPLHVQVTSEKPMLNQKVQFQVGSIIKLSALSYYIVGRGNVLLSKMVKVDQKNIETLEFEPTFSMVPVCSLVVFYVEKSGEIVSDYTDITFLQDDILNLVSVSVSKSNLEPKQELKITINSEEGSYIGLSCIDQSVLLTKKGNDLSRTKIFNDLQQYDNNGDIDLNEAFTQSFTTLLKPGTIVLTDATHFKEGVNKSLSLKYIRTNLKLDYSPDIVSNILVPISASCDYSQTDDATKQRYLDQKGVRSDFPDTMLWEDILDSDYETVIYTKLPDSVTSWYFTAFSLNSEHGLGLTKTPLIITAFKPFFIDVSLPRTTVVGEFLPITVTVHNYFEQSVTVEIELFSENGDFEIVSNARKLAETDYYEDDYDLRSLETNTLNVKAEGEASLAFTIKTKKVGVIQIRAAATSSIACDNMLKSLLVKADGVTIHQTQSQPMLLTGKPVANTLTVTIPDEAIADSVKIRLTIQGDKYSLDLENFRNNLASPTGSGVSYFEEFVRYMVNTNNFLATQPMIDGIKESVTTNSQEALDYLLKLQCDDGGYTANENCSETYRDTWFTASNVAVLGESSTTLPLDVDILLKSLEYLVSIQLPDGRFPELSLTPESDVYTDGPRLTAYVLYVFITTKTYLPEQNLYDEYIQAAVDNLLKQTSSLDMLALALLYNSLELLGNPNADIIKDIIEFNFFKSENSIRWFEDVETQAETEMLQLNLQTAMLLNEDPVTTMKIANGLTRSVVENFKVAYDSDITTAIKALALYSEMFSTSNSNISVSLSISESDITAIVDIEKSQRFLLNKFDIVSTVRSIGYTAKGMGFVNLALSYQYNLPQSKVVLPFDLITEVLPVPNQGWVLNVCTNFIAPEKERKSNDSIMEIKLPAGFRTTMFVQDYDEFTPNVKSKQLTNGGLIIYLDELDSKSVCIAVPLLRNIFVQQDLVGTVEIYEMRNPHYRAKDSFSLPAYDSSSLFEIEEKV